MIREINTDLICEKVAELCVVANKVLPSDIKESITLAKHREDNPLANQILADIEKNVEMATELDIPICQDTGIAVVFIEVGQDVHLVGEPLELIINRGVARGYENGLLRKSVVGDPLRRVNTGDNTPAIIHTKIVSGDKVTITVAPKGFGSENMSGVRMLTPAAGREGVINSVLEIVNNASGNPCPPMVIGVGIGGDFEQCALLSKKALCRSLNDRNPDPYYKELEDELLKKVNQLGIGPQGFGGKTTALGLNIEVAPTHIAGLPVAVNIGCHVTRHKTVTI